MVSLFNFRQESSGAAKADSKGKKELIVTILKLYKKEDEETLRYVHPEEKIICDVRHAIVSPLKVHSVTEFYYLFSLRPQRLIIPWMWNNLGLFALMGKRKKMKRKIALNSEGSASFLEKHFIQLV